MNKLLMSGVSSVSVWRLSARLVMKNLKNDLGSTAIWCCIMLNCGDAAMVSIELPPASAPWYACDLGSDESHIGPMAATENAPEERLRKLLISLPPSAACVKKAEIAPAHKVRHRHGTD